MKIPGITRTATLVCTIALGIHHVYSTQVVIWGLATNVPPNLTNAVSVYAGGDFSAAITSEGRAIIWNEVGFQYQPWPPNIVSIACGRSHALGLSADGFVHGWGYNGWGQADIPSGLSNVVAVAAGLIHSLALTAQGEVIAWGNNTYGELDVPEGWSNFVGIAAGAFTSYALTSDGRVVAWGENNQGEAVVPVGLTNVVSIGAGIDYCLALTADGRLVKWGTNDWQNSIQIPPDLTNVVSFTAGGQLAYALTEDRRIVGMGYSAAPGATRYERALSIEMPPGLSNVVMISAAPSGDGHKLALIDNEGVLPNATRPVRRIPAAVSAHRLSRAYIVVSWPTNYADFTLYSARNYNRRHPELTRWQRVSTEPLVLDGWLYVTNRVQRYGKTYRLAYP